MSSLRLRLHPTMDLILRPRGLQISVGNRKCLYLHLWISLQWWKGKFHSLEYVRLAGFFSPSVEALNSSKRSCRSGVSAIFFRVYECWLPESSKTRTIISWSLTTKLANAVCRSASLVVNAGLVEASPLKLVLLRCRGVASDCSPCNNWWCRWPQFATEQLGWRQILEKCLCC